MRPFDAHSGTERVGLGGLLFDIVMLYLEALQPEMAIESRRGPWPQACPRTHENYCPLIAAALDLALRGGWIARGRRGPWRGRGPRPPRAAAPPAL